MNVGQSFGRAPGAEERIKEVQEDTEGGGREIEQRW